MWRPQLPLTKAVDRLVEGSSHAQAILTALLKDTDFVLLQLVPGTPCSGTPTGTLLQLLLALLLHPACYHPKHKTHGHTCHRKSEVGPFFTPILSQDNDMKVRISYALRNI